MNFLERIRRFLYGRYITYGIDQLGILLIAACCLLAFVNLFFRLLAVYLIQIGLLVWFLYRLLSRNVAARQRENETIRRLGNRLSAAWKLEKRKYGDRQTHIYKTCPHCGVTLRLPRTPGEHNVNCPRCRNNFSVKVKR